MEPRMSKSGPGTKARLGLDWNQTGTELGPDQDKGVRRKSEDKGQALPFKILLQPTPAQTKEILSFFLSLLPVLFFVPIIHTLG